MVEWQSFELKIDKCELVKPGQGEITFSQMPFGQMRIGHSGN
jgi:hypothetical protein